MDPRQDAAPAEQSSKSTPQLVDDGPLDGWPRDGTNHIRSAVGPAKGFYLTYNPAQSVGPLTFEKAPSAGSVWSMEFHHNGNPSLPNVIYRIRNTLSGKYLGWHASFPWAVATQEATNDNFWQVFRGDAGFSMRATGPNMPCHTSAWVWLAIEASNPGHEIYASDFVCGEGGGQVQGFPADASRCLLYFDVA